MQQLAYLLFVDFFLYIGSIQTSPTIYIYIALHNLAVSTEFKYR